jgi:glutamate 5-kinase
MTAALAHSKRLIVKIGSALLVDPASLAIRQDWLDALGDDLARCRRRGQEVLVVASGAVAIGRVKLGLGLRPLALEEKQAAAAVGQIRLAQLFQDTLARHDITVAQVLVTLDDTEARRRHLNGRATLEQLLRYGTMPVINENDTVATAEIRFGDNDRLAARVAQMASADTLVLLSDIDGLYTADPRTNPDAEHLAEVRDITDAIEAMAAPAAPGISSGGMVTKLQAARIAMAAGCRMVLGQGRTNRPLAAIEEGARCTWFLPSATPLTARKRWIAGAIAPAGAVIVDDGAVTALLDGSSLLPAGIIGVEGAFEKGDAILVRQRDGVVLGRGLTAYGSVEVAILSGHKSGEIETLLGYRGRDVVIHRDDLVLVR